jgi:hypothetical protein
LTAAADVGGTVRAENLEVVRDGFKFLHNWCDWLIARVWPELHAGTGSPRERSPRRWGMSAQGMHYVSSTDSDGSRPGVIRIVLDQVALPRQQPSAG